MNNTKIKAKIYVARDVLSNGMKIKMAALKHGVSVSTVRTYMDLYTEKKLTLDVKAELESLRLHVHCAKLDTRDTLEGRMKEMDGVLVLLGDSFVNGAIA
jgi:transposase-like protein